MTVAKPQTVGELYDLYYTRHALANIRCPKNVFYFAKVHGEHWFKQPLTSITRWDVQEWVDRLGLQSKSAANRALHHLSAIINWGIRRDYCQEPNPCRWVEKYRLRSRERFLQPEEIDAFKQVLDGQSELCRDFFWMLLYTGARKGNTLAMRWADISFSNESWTIPGDIHKNDTSHVIALGEPALEILRRRKESATSEWVFPGRLPGSHYTEPKRVWKTITKKAGLEDVRIHDLRRTLGSYMAISGCGLPIIGKALGHKDQRSTAIYARLDLTSVRGALNKVYSMYGENISAPVKVDQRPNVVVELVQRKVAAQLDEVEQVDPFLRTIIEGKILTCILEGRPTKSTFHSKMRGRVAINAKQLDAILRGMEEREIIAQTVAARSLGKNIIEYRLAQLAGSSENELARNESQSA